MRRRGFWEDVIIFAEERERTKQRNFTYFHQIPAGTQPSGDCFLDGIECDMLKQPKLSGVAATCNGQLVPAIFRNDCGNCFGRNRDI